MSRVVSHAEAVVHKYRHTAITRDEMYAEVLRELRRLEQADMERRLNEVRR